MDLGLHPPSDQFRTNSQINDSVIFYPLGVNICEDCGFVQLGYIVPPPEILYQDNYPYESSTTQMGQKHYSDFAESVVNTFNLGGNDLVVDIGSNVGVLLDVFKNQGLRVQGIDPAGNICEIAELRGIPTINAFFGETSAKQVLDSHGMASVITGTNAFAHVDDQNAFMRAVELLLDFKDGLKFMSYPNKKLLGKNICLKTKGRGKVAFLLATGPSVKNENLKVLAGKDCYSASNFFLHEDIKTINPKFHFFAPYHEPLILENYIEWLRKGDRDLPAETKIFLATVRLIWLGNTIFSKIVRFTTYIFHNPHAAEK